jgi:hypothetical protein
MSSSKTSLEGAVEEVLVEGVGLPLVGVVSPHWRAVVDSGKSTHSSDTLNDMPLLGFSCTIKISPLLVFDRILLITDSGTTEVGVRAVAYVLPYYRCFSLSMMLWSEVHPTNSSTVFCVAVTH